LKQRHDAVVGALYNLQAQCVQCGLRFTEDHKFREHQEWHAVRAAAKKAAVMATAERGWCVCTASLS
jgi:hypothetical protein